MKKSYIVFFGITLIILIIVCFCMVWETGRQSELYIRDGWQYRWEQALVTVDESSLGSIERSEHEEWHEISFPQQLSDWDGKSILWMRVKLSPITYERPILFLTLVSHHMECWVDGKRIYQYGQIPVLEHERYNPLFPQHLIFLPSDSAGKEVYLRIHSNGQKIGLGGLPRVGSLSEFLASRARMDFFKVGSAVLCFFGSMVALAIALCDKNRQSYYAFAGCAFCNGLIVLVGTFCLYLIIPLPQVILVSLMGGALFWQGFWLWFLESIVKSQYHKTVRRARNTVFTIASIGMISVIVDSRISIFLLNIVLVMLVLNMVLLCFVFRNELKENVEAQLYAIGAFAWIIATGVDGLRAIGIIALPTTTSACGQLIDIGCQAFILSRRVSALYRQKDIDTAHIRCNNLNLNLMNSQIREINDSLEQQVSERTEKLKETVLLLEERNEKLARMETARRHLLSNIAHDLRTPITMIRGHIEAILDGMVQESGKQQRSLQIIHSKTMLLKHLIQDVFLLSQLESGTLYLNKKKVVVGEFLRGVIASYEMDAMSFGVNLSLVISADSVDKTISIDALRMEQVFANLIYNALRYTPREGCITLSATVDIPTARIVLSVEDTGTGIAAADISQIFERFYAGESTTYSKNSGTGLGLAIAREITEMQGGCIWAENIPCSGGIFRIGLPLCLDVEQ